MNGNFSSMHKITKLFWKLRCTPFYSDKSSVFSPHRCKEYCTQIHTQRNFWLAYASARLCIECQWPHPHPAFNLEHAGGSLWCAPIRSTNECRSVSLWAISGWSRSAFWVNTQTQWADKAVISRNKKQQTTYRRTDANCHKNVSLLQKDVRQNIYRKKWKGTFRSSFCPYAWEKRAV